MYCINKNKYNSCYINISKLQYLHCNIVSTWWTNLNLKLALMFWTIIKYKPSNLSGKDKTKYKLQLILKLISFAEDLSWTC